MIPNNLPPAQYPQYFERTGIEKNCSVTRTNHSNGHTNTDRQHILNTLKSSLLAFLSETPIDNNYILCGSTALGVHLNELLKSPEHHRKFADLPSEKKQITSIDIDNQNDFDLVTNSQNPNISELITTIKTGLGESFALQELESEEYSRRKSAPKSMEHNELLLIKSDSIGLQSCYRGDDLDIFKLEKGVNIITGKSQTLTIMHLNKILFKIDIIYQPEDQKVFAKHPSLLNIFEQEFNSKQVEFQHNIYQVNIFNLSALTGMLNTGFINTTNSCRTNNNKFLNRLILLNKLSDANILRNENGFLHSTFHQFAENHSLSRPSLSNIEKYYIKVNQKELTQQAIEKILQKREVELTDMAIKEIKEGLEEKLKNNIRTMESEITDQYHKAEAKKKNINQDQSCKAKQDYSKTITITTATQTESSWIDTSVEKNILAAPVHISPIKKEKEKEKENKLSTNGIQINNRRHNKQKDALSRVTSYLNKALYSMDNEDKTIGKRMSGGINNLFNAYDEYNKLKDNGSIFNSSTDLTNIDHISKSLTQLLFKMRDLLTMQGTLPLDGFSFSLVLYNFFYYVCVDGIRHTGRELQKCRLSFAADIDKILSRWPIATELAKFDSDKNPAKKRVVKYLSGLVSDLLSIYVGRRNSARIVRSEHPIVITRALKYLSSFGGIKDPSAVIEQLKLYQLDKKYYKANINQFKDHHLTIVNTAFDTITEPFYYFDDISDLYKWFYENNYCELSALILIKHLEFIVTPQHVKYRRQAIDDGFLAEENLKFIVEIYKQLPQSIEPIAKLATFPEYSLRKVMRKALHNNIHHVREYFNKNGIKLDTLNVPRPEVVNSQSQPWFSNSYIKWCSIL